MANTPLAQTLETERFLLDPVSRLTAFAISYPWTKDPELIGDFTSSSAPRTRRKWYREMTRPNNRTKFCHAIYPKGNSKPIGMHMTALRNHRSAQTSIAIHDRTWWGKGAVEEVRTRIIDHFFEHGPVDRFWAAVKARNLPSVFNYRKLGYRHVGTLHRSQSDPVTGEIFDMVLFELFREDWDQRRKTLGVG
jgi:RimJ/RimL family protein N-acetyltransferase